MSEKIKSEIKLITPELARTYLISNENNRRVRQSWVNYLAYCIRNNEWKLTHQGIAFSENGRLLDGQHRLMAIVKADIPALVVVSYGWNESVFSALDNGVRRSDSDRTNLNKKLIECAKMFISVMGYTDHRSISEIGRSTPEQITHYANVIDSFNTLLMNCCNTTGTIFSSAPSRSAAIANLMLCEDLDYVTDLYRKLALGKSEELPPIGRSAMRQCLTGSIRSGGGGDARLDNFVRFFTVFDKKNKDAQKLMLCSRNERLSRIRQELMPFFVNDSPKNGAKSINGRIAISKLRAAASLSN